MVAHSDEPFIVCPRSPDAKVTADPPNIQQSGRLGMGLLQHPADANHTVPLLGRSPQPGACICAGGEDVFGR